MPKRRIDDLLERLDGLEVSVHLLLDATQDHRLPPDVRQMVQWLRRHLLLDRRVEAVRRWRRAGLSNQETAERLGVDRPQELDKRQVQRWQWSALPPFEVRNVQGFAFAVGLPDQEPVPGFIEGLRYTECGNTTHRLALPIIQATVRVGNTSVLLGYARVVPPPGSDTVQMPIAPLTPRWTYCRHCRFEREFTASQAWPLRYEVYQAWSRTPPAGRSGVLAWGFR